MNKGRDVPNLFVIAGPNGAGKSTIAPKLLADNRRVEAFVNADNIKVELGAKAGTSADILAGRIMLERVGKLVELSRDLAFETTLASRRSFHSGTGGAQTLPT